MNIYELVSLIGLNLAAESRTFYDRSRNATVLLRRVVKKSTLYFKPATVFNFTGTLTELYILKK